MYLADRWFYESHNMRSLISLPIKVDGRVQAVCILGKNEPGYYTNTHIHLVEALIGQAGVALQNAWLFDQVSAGHERLLNLSRQLVSVQEDERAYVSRELHDQTSQSMAAMLVELDLLSRSAESPETITEAVTRLEALVSQVMYDLHNIAIKLRPASLDHTGLVEAIRQYVSAFEKKYSHTAQFETFGMPFDLPEETNITLFRILQESLTNVLRHAKATRADVVLEYHSDHVTLLIEDNGVGFETRMRTNGIHLGLTGMRERVAMVQGDLLIESTPGEGTIIKVTIPLNELWSQREQDQSGIEVEM
ncbi:MAG: GAF domain-containing sensor histidine kinase [Desulforhabdus sp.]|nr:GAF domain-containing sensor histidine kinase [Desulforhabdus sp.]